MMSSRRVLPLVAWVLCAAGCGTLETHRVLTGYPGAPSGGDVLIFMQTQPGPTGLQEVGIVQAVGRGTFADLEHVIAGLKTEAASLGCTAVIGVKVDQGATTASATGVCLRPQGPAALPPGPTPSPVGSP
jgi:hypothetical protein